MISTLVEWRRQMNALERMGTLDETVLRAIVVAEENEVIGKWLERQAGPLWSTLGLFAHRLYRRVDGLGEPQPKGAGVWVVGMPEFVRAPRDGGGDEIRVADVLGFDPDGEGYVSSLRGDFDGVLGSWQAALVDAAPLRIMRSPMAWLRRERIDFDEPATICLAWPNTPTARHVLTMAAELIADDDEHAAELERQVKRIRKEASPPAARILVNVDDKAAA